MHVLTNHNPKSNDKNVFCGPYGGSQTNRDVTKFYIKRRKKPHRYLSSHMQGEPPVRFDAP